MRRCWSSDRDKRSRDDDLEKRRGNGEFERFSNGEIKKRRDSKTMHFIKIINKQKKNKKKN